MTKPVPSELAMIASQALVEVIDGHVKDNLARSGALPNLSAVGASLTSDGATNYVPNENQSEIIR